MNWIKKTIVLFFLLFLIVRPFVVFGQYQLFSQQPLPGVNCGVARDPKTGTTDIYQVDPSRCCSTAAANDVLDKFLSVDMQESNGINQTAGIIGRLVSGIPGLGFFLQGIADGLNQARVSYQQLKQYQKDNPGVACVFGEPDRPPTDPNCTCKSVDTPSANRSLAQLCYTYLSKGKNNELGSCVSCASGGGIWTAIGCVPTKIQGFISTFLLSTGIGFGGIIALICIIYAAFQIQTSRGNPEKIKKAQELLTSCIMGLMLIIFSVFILRLIGVNILRIPFLN